MLHEQTKRYILSLGDSELLEYVLTGRRIYEPEAIAFAQEELDRRGLTSEQLAALRPQIVEKLAVHDATKSVDQVRGTPTIAILCDGCGRQVPNTYVIYRENIGVMVMRIRTYRKGCFCKMCNRKAFFRSTAITALVGWFGHISFFVAPAYLVANVFNFIRTLSLPGVPHGAGKPVVDDAVIGKIAPQVYVITERLHSGTDISEISREIAPKVDVTPGQVLCFIRTMLERQAATRAGQGPAHSFPVGGPPNGLVPNVMI